MKKCTINNTTMIDEVKKKNIVITCPKNLADDFRILCFESYKNLGILSFFNYSSYFKACIKKLEDNFIVAYDKISTPDDNDLKFYSRRKQVNPLTNKYAVNDDINTLTFRLDQENINLLYALIHTIYINKYSKIYPVFSVSIFFQLVLQDIKEMNFEIKDLID